MATNLFKRYGTEPGAPLVQYYGTSLRAIVWHKTRAIPLGRYGTSLRAILWHKCRAIPCAIERLSSPAAISRAILYLPNPVPYPCHTLATFPSAEHIVFPHVNHTRAIPKTAQEQSRTAHLLKQQQTLQSSRRLERQSSQEQSRTAQEQSRTAQGPFHTFQFVQVWNKPSCHTMEQGSCHTLRKVWNKPPCHTMEQGFCKWRPWVKAKKSLPNIDMYA